MPQTIWIARHGNRLDFVNPAWFETAIRRYDPPLSDDGLIQAAELGKRLQSTNIKHIFASPFLRTIQTAHKVAQVLKLPIKLEAGLGEWHNPEWMSEPPELHPSEMLTREYPEIDENYQSFIYPQYPETKEQVNKRTAATVRHLVAKYDEDILLVGHGASVYGATKSLVATVPDLKVSLCCLTKLIQQETNSWSLEFYGDTSHLTQIESQVRWN